MRYKEAAALLLPLKPRILDVRRSVRGVLERRFHHRLTNLKRKMKYRFVSVLKHSTQMLRLISAMQNSEFVSRTDLDLCRQRAGVREGFRGHAVCLRRAHSGRHEAGLRRRGIWSYGYRRLARLLSCGSEIQQLKNDRCI